MSEEQLKPAPRQAPRAAKPEEPKPEALAPKKPGPPKARVCSENDRAAGTGLKRWKIRANNYSPTARTRYLLAASAEEALAEYRRAVGLDAELEKLRARGVTPEEPELIVTDLQD